MAVGAECEWEGGELEGAEPGVMDLLHEAQVLDLWVVDGLVEVIDGGDAGVEVGSDLDPFGLGFGGEECGEVRPELVLLVDEGDAFVHADAHEEPLEGPGFEQSEEDGFVVGGAVAGVVGSAAVHPCLSGLGGLPIGLIAFADGEEVEEKSGVEHGCVDADGLGVALGSGEEGGDCGEGGGLSGKDVGDGCGEWCGEAFCVVVGVAEVSREGEDVVVVACEVGEWAAESVGCEGHIYNEW